VDSNPHSTHPLTLIATRFCSFRRQHGLACVESGRNLTKLWGDQKVNNGAVNPMCDREGAPKPPRRSPSPSRTVFFIRLKSSHSLVWNAMRALRVDPRVFAFITGENLAARTSPRPGRTRLKLCFALSIQDHKRGARDFRPQQRGLAKEPRRLA
jgi:hypothetical protein